MTIVARLTDVSRIYPPRAGHAAVHAMGPLSLELRAGEFFSVVGPSGCGKSTLLDVLSGLSAPTQGSVEFEGKPVAGVVPEGVGVVFQEDASFPWLTVEDNIAYSLRLRRLPADEIRKTVDHYLSLVGLTSFRKSWPRQLSGGMKKRVDIARGYAADPKVLLMDEPFGALDIMTKERLQEELHKLWSLAPRTVFFITHDLEEALFLGDRVILMSPRPGRIAFEYRPGFAAARDMSIKNSGEFTELAKELRNALKGFEQADGTH